MSIKKFIRASSREFCGGFAPVALNPLSVACASRNSHMEALDLFAAGGEAHFQFEAIVVSGIRLGSIERDEGGKFSSQTLFDIGRFKSGAAHGDGAVLGRNGQPDCRQRTGGAIRPHTGIDADTHFASRCRLDFAIERRGLAVDGARAGTQHKAQCQPAPFTS